MEFYEKLSFLLHITNTNNNELAEALNVGPSIISLYKTGRRPMPKKSSKIRKLSHFFGVQVLNKYQRQALAEKMENNIILTQYTPCDVEEAIFCWFTDEKMAANGPTQRLLTAMTEPKHNYDTSNSAIVPAITSTKIYHGVPGKIAAIKEFLAHLLTVDNPKELYVHGDNFNQWLYNDPALETNLLYTIEKLIQKGCIVYQVLPPTSNEFLLETFSAWIPFYLTGKVIPYFYPRYRDQVFRGFQLALDNRIGILSYGIMNGHAQGFAAVVTEEPLVADIADTVKDMINISQPALSFFKAAEDSVNAFKTFLTIPAPRISFRNSLPPELLPKQDIENLAKILPATAGKALFNFYDLNKNNANDVKHVELLKIANAKQVRAGKVKIICPAVPISEWPTYTPAAYARHLRNVINKLEKDDNYFVAPLPYDYSKDCAIFIRQNTIAVFHNHEPFISYIIKAPELIRALQENLYRKLDGINYAENGKKQVIKQLLDLIDELKR